MCTYISTSEVNTTFSTGMQQQWEAQLTFSKVSAKCCGKEKTSPAAPQEKPPSPTYLQHGEAGLAWQAEFLLLWGVGVEAVLIQPATQNLYRLLRQVAAATALPRQPSSWQVEWGAIITVRHGWGVLLLPETLFFQSWGEGAECQSL